MGLTGSFICEAALGQANQHEPRGKGNGEKVNKLGCQKEARGRRGNGNGRKDGCSSSSSSSSGGGRSRTTWSLLVVTLQSTLCCQMPHVRLYRVLKQVQLKLLVVVVMMMLVSGQVLRKGRCI